MTLRPGPLVAIAAGVWLMFAPAAADYAGTATSDLHRSAGPVIAALGVMSLWEVMLPVRWLASPIALGAFFATGALGDEHALLAAAPALVAVAGTAAFGGRRKRRIGGGWQSLAGRDTPRQRGDAP